MYQYLMMINWAPEYYPFQVGKGSFSRKNSLFPGEQIHSSGKSAKFPENKIISIRKKYISDWNWIILRGNRPNSRETRSFFREKIYFQLELDQFSGKTVYFPENIPFFRET